MMNIPLLHVHCGQMIDWIKDQIYKKADFQFYRSAHLIFTLKNILKPSKIRHIVGSNRRVILRIHGTCLELRLPEIAATFELPLRGSRPTMGLEFICHEAIARHKEILDIKGLPKALEASVDEFIHETTKEFHKNIDVEGTDSEIELIRRKRRKYYLAMTNAAIIIQHKASVVQLGREWGGDFIPHPDPPRLTMAVFSTAVPTFGDRLYTIFQNICEHVKPISAKLEPTMVVGEGNSLRLKVTFNQQSHDIFRQLSSIIYGTLPCGDLVVDDYIEPCLTLGTVGDCGHVTDLKLVDDAKILQPLDMIDIGQIDYFHHT